jgi:hypothetical protein
MTLTIKGKEYEIPFLSIADTIEYRDDIKRAVEREEGGFFLDQTGAGAAIIAAKMARTYPEDFNEKDVLAALPHFKVPIIFGYILNGPKATEPTPVEKSPTSSAS